MAPRAGSRKASVFTTFMQQGAEAAIAIGTSAGLKLGTIKSWIGGWSKDSPGAPKPKGRAMTTKPTVIVTWDPERTAYMIEEGPEQSWIRWQDTGVEFSIPNSHLKKE